MTKSAYEELILSLIDQGELHIECTEDFNLNSFRSAFYRFRSSDIGRMMTSDLELRMKTYYDEGVKIAQLNVVSHKKLTFKVRSKPNGTTI